MKKSFFLFIASICLMVFFGQAPVSAGEGPTDSRSYVLFGSFIGLVPFTVNYTSGVVSGEYSSTGPVTSELNPGRQETITKNGTVEGEFRNGTVNLTIYESRIEFFTAACGNYSIKTHAEYYLTGTVASDGAITQTGDVATRYKLDSSMLVGAKKVEGQNVPPIYVVQCGNQTSGYSFADKNLAWISSTIKGSSGAWTVETCTEHQQLNGTSCVCKPGEEEACKKEAAGPVTTPPITVRYGADEATYKRGDGTEAPLTKSTKLVPGDTVFALTENLTLNIGDQLITVYAPSSFKLEAAYLTADQIAKTRVYLLDGSIKSKIPHRAGVRGDFHVATPGANSSIRGSEMVVNYDKKQDITTVFVTEDKAYVQGKNDAQEVTVSEGRKVIIGADGKITAPQSYNASELPVDKKQGFSIPMWGWIALGAGVLVIIGIGVMIKKRRA